MLQNKLLKINSVGNESKELLKILDVIINYDSLIADYFFSITIFDGLPNDNFEGSFMTFYEEVNKDEKLIMYNLNELIKIISGVRQVFDLLLLIDNKSNKFKRYSIEEERMMYKEIFVTIAYFDGGFWEVSSTNDLLIDTLKNALENVEIID